MPQRFISALLIIGSVYRILAEKNELAASSEFIKKQPAREYHFPNNVRDKNSTGIPTPKSNRSAYDYDQIFDQQSRASNHRSDFEFRGSSCCGSRRGWDSFGRPDSYRDRIPPYNSRYSTMFGDRPPIDRNGWQTQGRPLGWSGSNKTPGSGSYTETAFYEGSHAGYRPGYTSESSRKPSGYDSGVFGGYGYAAGGPGGYNSFTPPTGHGGSVVSAGYGISGTLANGDEFGYAGPNYPEENTPTRPNIQTQKAVALKALAGVALLGAAAALATKTVLLPLDVVSGRKKRSIDDKDAYVDYISMILKHNATKNSNDEGKMKTSVSPTCIARLACEIQKSHRSYLSKDIDFLEQNVALQRHLTNLIATDAPQEELGNMRLKQLMKVVSTVSSNGENCNAYACALAKKWKS